MDANLQKAFDRLKRKETKLKKNVKLSAINEIKALYEESIKLETEFRKLKDDIYEQSQKIKAGIDELVNTYTNGDGMLQEVIFKSYKMSELLNELYDKTEELGVKVTDVMPEFNEINDFTGSYEYGNFYDILNSDAQEIIDANY